uniref:Low molecular weight glutenin subunit n=1 Tax=Thinopyrum elongatum TaxID=4588 RepID=Q693B2_THIEL|nr:low molecular weight glutenin subunit [Thinopyrum elongatum]
MKTFLICALLAIAATSAIAQLPISQQQQPPFSTFLICALLAIAATSAIAQLPISQQQQPPFSQQPQISQRQQQPPLSQQEQQPFSQQQQPPFSQQQQPPFLQQQQISQLQQPPFSQQQQPPCSQQQQPPFSQQQPSFLQQQQPQISQHTNFTTTTTTILQQQQIPVIHPYVLQQLNPCKVFLQQQCSPVAMQRGLVRSQMLQQGSCHVLQQQCCQQLPQIPEQSRHEAIRAIVYSIILQEQQQGQGFIQPQQQQPQQSAQCVSQPQQQSQQQLGRQPQQQQLGQQPQQQQQVLQGTFLQPHQIAQLEAMTSIALRTLPRMCSVNVPLYGTASSVSFGVGTGVGAY